MSIGGGNGARRRIVHKRRLDVSAARGTVGYTALGPGDTHWSHDSMSYCLDTHSPAVSGSTDTLHCTPLCLPLGHHTALSTRPWSATSLSCLKTNSAPHRYRIDKTPLLPVSVRVGETPYLSQCWDLGQQVIISYDDETILHQHKELWSKISYWYTDSADPKEIISYLEERQKAQGRAAHFFTSGLNLTEDTAVVVCNPCLTMRKLTMKSFSLLLDWVEKQTPGPDLTAIKIICGDFVGRNHFASVVIGLKTENQGRSEKETDR
ncbi:uncharacterized protein [Salmo salar]|uniref:Uncharacterized protein n=1 Tax=Salmo salar TaxID=8030 RepID=A0ABM3D1K1_SALSA|nr:uncharacterized protein LOC106574967 [Salmo salar]